MGKHPAESPRMRRPVRGVLCALLPLSWQRRRITQATEMILSNIGLYASVRALSVDEGRRLVMELLSPVALPADVLDSIRRYLARKLHSLLGLRLRHDQLYLVSLPQGDAPVPPPEPSTGALRRAVNSLPLWAPSKVALTPAAPARMAASNDSTVPASRLDASDAPPQRLAARFELDDDPRWAAASMVVQEFSASQIGTGFAATQPVDRAGDLSPEVSRRESPTS